MRSQGHCGGILVLIFRKCFRTRARDFGGVVGSWVVGDNVPGASRRSVVGIAAEGGTEFLVDLEEFVG